MIPLAPDVDVQGNMQGEKIAMGVDQKSLVFIQSLLTDMYSDPELAVIREYSTNARDSHIQAGITKPIEVTTPSALDPTLRIKDYGVGLSLEDIRQVYSLYGASTKRNTNDQNGMLGLGCKAALTYTNQFTLRAVKDQQRVSVLISRDETGAGAMQILENTPVQEPNGVEIVVPAKDRNSFEHKAYRFFKYWVRSPVPVLLNGSPPPDLDLRWLPDLPVAIHKDLGVGRYYHDPPKVLVHMAGVTYPVDMSIISSDLQIKGAEIIIFADDGSVDFTPSREALHYTTRTKELIFSYLERTGSALLEVMQADIDAEPTVEQAYDTFSVWIKILYGSPRFSYRGKEMPASIDKVSDIYRVRKNSKNSYTSFAGVSGPRFESFLHTRENVVVVFGKTTEGLTNSQRAKLRTYAESRKEIYYEQIFIFVPDRGQEYWLDVFDQLEWDAILKISPTRKPAVPKPPQCVHLINSAGNKRSVFIDDLDKTKPIGYATHNELQGHGLYNLGQIADRYQLQIVCAPKKMQKPLTAAHPTAQPLPDLLATTARKLFVSIMTNVDQHGYTSSDRMSYIARDYLQSASEKILDPKLRAPLEDTSDPPLKNEKGWLRYLLVRSSIPVSERERMLDSISVGMDAIEKYPLLARVVHGDDDRIQEHLIMYVNMVYEREKNAV